MTQLKFMSLHCIILTWL